LFGQGNLREQSTSGSGKNCREKKEKHESDGEDLEAPEVDRFTRASVSHRRLPTLATRVS